jgi:hypothetical protein
VALNLNRLDRVTLIAVLKEHGYGCVEAEPTENLRDVVRRDRKRGEIKNAAIDLIRISILSSSIDAGAVLVHF